MNKKMTTTQPQQAQLVALGITSEMLDTRGLTWYEEADQSLLITVATNDEGRQYQLLPEAAAAWREIETAAANDGHQLIVLSAYRSVARQVELIQRKLDCGINIHEILTSIAPPGFSEHHTGRAIDVAAARYPELDESFAATAEYAWLTAHAGMYGFTLSYPRGNTLGYVFEPWHWCWHKK